MEQIKEGLVETPETAKTCGGGNVSHGQVRIVNKLLRKQDPSRLSD